MNKKVLVIGEVCTDIFRYGTSNRKSPEGNGPVFVPISETYGLGMAGNTANNLMAMGLDVDTYFDKGMITKTRYVNKDTNELYLRVDENDTTNRIDIYDLPDLVKYDAVVISDYCKGFLKEEDINTIASLHSLVILDTKKRLGDWCKDITFIKVNRQEFQNNFGVIKENDWLFEKIICTLDRGGAMYKTQTFKVHSVDTADVSGAGDTFVAGFIARYLDSENIEESIDWANYCAGEVVKEKGVSVFKNLKTI
jgi:D-beta-D-heptose 7-phosphate kinase/D-beta-D-heptose 1-phosphate adenosyltransferase